MLEARDKASEIFARIDGSLKKFTGTAAQASETVAAAGDRIDEGLLKTASGADALDVAASRTAGAQQRVTAAMTEQATAERELMAATAAETADTDAVAAASDRLAVAERNAAKAATELEAAQKRQSDTATAVAAKEDAAAGAQDRVSASSGRMGAAMKGVGLAAAGIAGGVALIGYHSVKAATTFQQSMTMIHTQAGAAGENINALGQQVIALGPKVGMGPNELAQGLYHVESAGLRGKQAMDVLAVAAKGAAIGNADLETVTQAMIAATSSGIKGVQNLSGAMGSLNAIVGSGDMRMDAFAHSMGTGILSTAKTFGLSLTDVGAAMATMTDNAVPADDAATRLRMTFSMLGAPSQAAAKSLATIGLSATSLADDMRKPNGLLLAMQDLRSHLNKPVTGSQFTGSTKQAMAALEKLGMTASQAKTRIGQIGVGGALAEGQLTKFGLTAKQVNTVMSGMGPNATQQAIILARAFGGGRTSGAILTLLGQMDRFKSKYKDIGDGAKNFGKSWEETTKTAVFQSKSLHASVEAVSTSLGTALLPTVQKLMGEIIKIVGPIVNWINSHQKLAGQIFMGIGALALFTASVAAVSKVVGAVTKTASAAAKGFELLSKGASGVATGVGKAASGIGSAAKATASFTGRIRDGFKSAEAAQSSFSGAAGTLGGKLRTAWDGTTTAMSKVGPKLLEIGKSAKDGLVTVGQLAAKWAAAGAAAAASAVKFLAVKTAEAAVAVATRAWAVVQAALNVVMSMNPIGLVVIAIGLLVAAAIYCYTHFKIFKQVVDDVFGFLKTAVVDVIHFVEQHWRLIISIMLGPLGIVISLVTKYWKDIPRLFMDGVHLVESVLSWFGKLPGMFGRWLLDAASAVGRGVDRVVSWLGGLPGRAVHALASMGGDMLSIGKNVMIGLYNGLVSMGSWLFNAVTSLISSVIPGPIKKVLGIASPSTLTHWFGQMVGHGLANGILSQYGRIRQAVTGMAAIVSGTTIQGPGLAGGALGLAGGLSGGGLPSLAGAGGAPVQITIDLRGAQVMSDRDLNELVDKVGRAVATRILPQAGVRIAR